MLLTNYFISININLFLEVKYRAQTHITHTLVIEVEFTINFRTAYHYDLAICIGLCLKYLETHHSNNILRSWSLVLVSY